MNDNQEKILKKFRKKITSDSPILQRGGNLYLKCISIIREKIRILSLFNIVYYLYPINLSGIGGYVTNVNRKGISGIAKGIDGDEPVKVELFVDGKIINTTWASQKISYPLLYAGEKIGFFFPMKYVWKYISEKQKIEVKAEEVPLRYRAGKPDSGKYALPHVKRKADGKRNILDYISSGSVITKFGKVQTPKNTNKKWENKVFGNYVELNKVFEKKIGKSIYLFYGCLLGYAREGGIMAHDNDLDLAYFSEKSDPSAVQKEFYEITKKLTDCGLDVIPVYYKILFKGSGLSITPTWISEDGEFASTFGYVGDGFSVEKKDILPFKKYHQGDHNIYLPAKPENVARYLYGKGWKYPDPGWKWLAEYKNYPHVLKARLTVRQVKDLKKLAGN